MLLHLITKCYFLYTQYIVKIIDRFDNVTFAGATSSLLDDNDDAYTLMIVCHYHLKYYQYYDIN